MLNFINQLMMINICQEKHLLMIKIIRGLIAKLILI